MLRSFRRPRPSCGRHRPRASKRLSSRHPSSRHPSSRHRPRRRPWSQLSHRPGVLRPSECRRSWSRPSSRRLPSSNLPFRRPGSTPRPPRPPSTCPRPPPRPQSTYPRPQRRRTSRTCRRRSAWSPRRFRRTTQPVRPRRDWASSLRRLPTSKPFWVSRRGACPPHIPMTSVRARRCPNRRTPHGTTPHRMRMTTSTTSTVPSEPARSRWTPPVRCMSSPRRRSRSRRCGWRKTSTPSSTRSRSRIPRLSSSRQERSPPRSTCGRDAPLACSGCGSPPTPRSCRCRSAPCCSDSG
jgi:hypothetical protein